jgi:hypothetical protein
MGIRMSGLRKRLMLHYAPQETLMRDAIKGLRDIMGTQFTRVSSEEILSRARLVQLTRESDTYTVLRMRRGNTARFFRYEGLQFLEEARRLDRPVVLLTSHMGSLYTMNVAVGFQGFRVFPIARSVDRSPATSESERKYLTLNYRLTGLKLKGRYLFTDFSSRMDRSIISLFNCKGICCNAIDIPRNLYPHKHEPVTFLGRRATLPAGFIYWAVKKEAVFLTMWNIVDAVDEKALHRCVKIEPIIETSDVGSILQCYANRLTKVICQEPWQWMGLPIARQYHEP